jgi:hypothetical protein
MVELNCKNSVVRQRSSVNRLMRVEPEGHFDPIKLRSDQGPVLSNRVIDTAADLESETAPTCKSVAAIMHVHVIACAPVAHLRTSEAIVTDLVAQPRRMIQRQAVLFVSEAHRNVRKAIHTKQEAKEAKSMANWYFPRRDTKPSF